MAIQRHIRHSTEEATPENPTSPTRAVTVSPTTPQVRPNLLTRRHLRNIVRDEVENVVEAHPEWSKEEILANVRERLAESFETSPFWDYILELLRILAPILIDILLSRH